MKEYELITKLFGNIDNLFESDAQIVDINGQKWGITCDNFSLEEDLFTHDKPYRLGCNLVTATLSDLFASGCKPSFYQHSVILPKNCPEQWVIELVNGIKDTLKKADCILIGGDMGQSDKFGYTGIALGQQIKNISRIFPKINQKIYVTGKLGDANEAILTAQSTPEFELRKIPQKALSCIDTSGGFIDALWQLHELNPDFKIDIKNVPVNDIALLFGGAGEYELLFTSDSPCENCENAFCIGEVIYKEHGVYLNEVELTQAPPDARDYDNMENYIGDIKRMVYGYFG
ncbi:MAG: AIR synthase related protein [Candidatus Gastranaerophilales bacterium]|nr:AIR synthase related protein [Candidatus Gastranaerophilales bacterium]